jgi:hypothetical protein
MTALNKQARCPARYGINAQGIFTNITYGAYVSYFDYLSLLDELEAMQNYVKDRDAENEDLMLTVGRLRVEREAAEKRTAELSKAASVSSQWKPDVCPITGREFFMWIEHPTLGYVPTYGGPFDSYTIPTKGSDGEFSCERYDHDFGGWVEGVCLGLYLIDDDERCRIDGSGMS